jgi:hypothetical protein
VRELERSCSVFEGGKKGRKWRVAQYKKKEKKKREKLLFIQRKNEGSFSL